MEQMKAVIRKMELDRLYYTPYTFDNVRFTGYEPF